MRIAAQASIDRSTRERLSLCPLAGLAALDRPLQPPACVLDLSSSIRRSKTTSPMISVMVSRSSSASTDSMALRPAMKPAGRPQSSGGQAPRPPMQAGYAFPASRSSQFSMRTS